VVLSALSFALSAVGWLPSCEEGKRFLLKVLARVLPRTGLGTGGASITFALYYGLGLPL
jgi:hypothetical protein